AAARSSNQPRSVTAAWLGVSGAVQGDVLAEVLQGGLQVCQEVLDVAGVLGRLPRRGLLAAGDFGGAPVEGGRVLDAGGEGGQLLLLRGLFQLRNPRLASPYLFLSLHQLNRPLDAVLFQGDLDIPDLGLHGADVEALLNAVADGGPDAREGRRDP